MAERKTSSFILLANDLDTSAWLRVQAASVAVAEGFWPSDDRWFDRVFATADEEVGNRQLTVRAAIDWTLWAARHLIVGGRSATKPAMPRPSHTIPADDPPPGVFSPFAQKVIAGSKPQRLALLLGFLRVESDPERLARRFGAPTSLVKEELAEAIFDAADIPPNLRRAFAPHVEDILFCRRHGKKFEGDFELQADEIVCHAIELALDAFWPSLEQSQSIVCCDPFRQPTSNETPDDEFPAALRNRFDSEIRIGRGGGAIVWRAVDQLLRRTVVVKVIKEISDRLAEARSLANLRHPHVVLVLEVFDILPGVALVLEDNQGSDVQKIVQEHGPMPWPAAARIVCEIADAVGALHATGLVHTDIKPGNIIVDRRDGRAILIDFGLVVERGRVPEGFTPAFSPPETFETGVATEKYDVYSLAATFVWMVSPFGDASPSERLQTLRLPHDIEELMGRALSRNLDVRPDADEFKRKLQVSIARFREDVARREKDLVARVDLSIRVTRETSRGIVNLPSMSHSSRVVRRDMGEPRTVAARTGDDVLIQVGSKETGFVTVFNIGPKGNFNLISQGVEIGAQNSMLREITLVAPAGVERLIAIWNRHRPPLNEREFRELSDRMRSLGPGFVGRAEHEDIFRESDEFVVTEIEIEHMEALTEHDR